MTGFIDFYYAYMEGGVEMLVMLWFFTKFLGKKIKPVHYLASGMLGAVGVACLPGGNAAQFVICMAVLAAEGIWACRARYDVVLLYAVITTEIMRLSYGIFGALSRILSPAVFPLNSGMAGMIFMGIGNILALLLAVLCYQAVCRYFLFDGAVKMQYVLLILAPVLLIFSVSGYISSVIYGNTLLMGNGGEIIGADHYQICLIQILGLISLFCVLYAYRKLLDSFSLRMKISLLEQETHSMRQYVEEAQARYEKTTSFRHDIKNHIEIVGELLENGQPERALAYISEMRDMAVDLSFPCHTDNPVLDILLANKLGVAGSRGIKVSCSLCVPCPCGISDMDFCVILSNALDNALRACEEAGEGAERYIRVAGRRQGSFLLIEVQNSVLNPHAFQEGTGLKNIRAAAEKYHGSMHIQTRGAEVTLSVLLVIPPENPPAAPPQEDSVLPQPEIISPQPEIIPPQMH